MKFIKRLFGRETRPPDPVIQPIFNADGVLLCVLRVDGGMNMEQMAVPIPWVMNRPRERPWYVGEPISLELSNDVVVMRKGSEEVQVFDAKGDHAQAKALLVLLRQRWFEANSGILAGLGSSVGALKPLGAPISRRSPWVLRLGYLCGFVGVFAAGLGAMHYYLHPGGVGLDMTGMSIEDVAKMDSNPAMVRDVQDQMMAAVSLGQENAKKISGKIEQDHIAALKAMGLNTGVSMSNALSCLAQK